MATFNDIKKLISHQTSEIKSATPHIIAHSATSFFKDRFRQKEWEGNTWQQTKHPNSRGSLMVRSGALMTSIRASRVDEQEVWMSAGDNKVPYAKVHNEGANDLISIKPHTRTVRGKKQQVQPYMRTLSMPQRQFMGDSPRLNDIILKRINNLIKQKTK